MVGESLEGARQLPYRRLREATRNGEATRNSPAWRNSLAWMGVTVTEDRYNMGFKC